MTVLYNSNADFPARFAVMCGYMYVFKDPVKMSILGSITSSSVKLYYYVRLSVYLCVCCVLLYFFTA
jgi:hypothetical protein